jgi:hypothetical protein
MAERSVFDQLVAELSVEERIDLLERIRSKTPVSDEPLFPETAFASARIRTATRVEDLGFLARIALFFRRIFTGKSQDELVRFDELRDIGRRIDYRQPGMLDRRHGLLLAPAAEELRALRDAARFFYDVLDRSVEKDKAAFYAFLASIEVPETHRRLMTETDPFQGSRDARDESDMRAAVLDAFDRAIAEMPDEGRRAMYQDLRSVLFLKRLSGFLFERLLQAFRPGADPSGGEAASLFEVRDLLLELGDILLSMSEPPSIELMEALFVASERDELAKRGADAESLLGADIAKAESALSRIRGFNARVPLGDLLCLASGNPSYHPRELPGGEDWLAILKAFWRERIDEQLEEWRTARRYTALAEEIASFVGEPGPAGFLNISREEREAAPAVKLDVALSFLDAFYRGPFLRELNRPLKIVLVDGEFYRKDNRVEFTDAYDALLHIDEQVTQLDARLAPEGEFGQAWAQARDELGSAAGRRRKLQAIARSAEEEAERIARRAGYGLSTLGKILGGFLKGDAGGRYDSLANMSFLDGKANKEFVRSLENAKDRCERALILLAELSGLDLS